MDSRRYNIMMLTARREAEKVFERFQRRFYARNFEAFEREAQALIGMQQAMATEVGEAPPLEPPTLEVEDG